MILILWLALFLRVWQLDTLPPGLHYDEAFNGTMARDVLRGINRPIFFTPNFGEEPLHIYTEALLFSFLGESPWTIRLVSAVFGLVFVAAVYAAARAFFPRSDLVAIVSAFIAATLYWAINFSRIGIETNGMPMLLTLSAAAIAHAYRKMTWGWVVGAGFLIGATVYTYLASRVWLPAVFLWFLYLVVFHRAIVRENFSKWLVMGAVTIVTLLPLAYFFATNPVAFSGRSGTVFTPEIALLNIARTAGMFFISGDLDPRDNLPGRPALDPILAVLFLIGLVITIRRARQPLYAFLLIWFVVMCLPSALTEFAPNFRRAIGAMPAMILMIALGVEWVWQMLADRISPVASPKSQVTGRASPIAYRESSETIQLPSSKFCSLQSPVSKSSFLRMGIALLLLFSLLLSAVLSIRAYFVDWASGTGLYYSFDAGLLQTARALAARPAGEPIYLTPDYNEHYTVIWALDGRPVSSFDGRRVLVLPNSDGAATYGIITREDSRTLAALQPYRTETLQSISDFDAQRYSQLLLLDPVAASPISTPIGDSRFGDLAEFGYALDPSSRFAAGGTIGLDAAWQAIKPTAERYTTFAQLVGPMNPATNSPVWAQQDRQPGNGTYATGEWRAGERIVEHFDLKIPEQALPGAYRVLIGMYLLETGERLPIFHSDGTHVPEDALLIHSFDLK